MYDNRDVMINIIGNASGLLYNSIDNNNPGVDRYRLQQALGQCDPVSETFDPRYVVCQWVYLK